MKILMANSGVLTNFDVLNFLESRGASKSDQTRVLSSVAPSEFKVYDYLVETPACTQTRENIEEFKEKCRQYDLAEAEVLNIINTRPSSMAELYSLIENCDLRYKDGVDQELLDMIAEVFPLPPAGTDESDANTTAAENIEDQNDNDEEKPADEEPMETTDGS